ncbi:MAG: universal stress protein [Burkholderiaceae bacterium]
MIRDLMLPMTGTAGDQNALLASLALAEMTSAHLAVIESVNLPSLMPNPWGFTPSAITSDLYDELRDLGAASAARLRERLERESVSWEVRVVESVAGDPSSTLALHARYANLSVMTAAPQKPAADAGIVEAMFTTLLFESGRPVLVIPPHHPAVLPISHAVVAWQPTREGTRALHDALPLLLTAKTVDVLTVDPVIGENHHGERPGADIAGHLARHGIKVNVVERPLLRESTATALLRHAVESGAQLLVAGGYGHSRLREWAIGGTTRELLRTICLPILFSH